MLFVHQESGVVAHCTTKILMHVQTLSSMVTLRRGIALYVDASDLKRTVITRIDLMIRMYTLIINILLFNFRNFLGRRGLKTFSIKLLEQAFLFLKRL